MSSSKDSPTKVPASAKPLWRQILNWPGTRMGWWSTGFFVAFVVLLILFYALVASGQRGGETFFSNLWLSLTLLPAVISAIVSGVLAAVAIAQKRERSLISFVALLIGVFVAIFAIGEIAFPH
jgi:cytochrome bd-type quinol oxidase subunit 2